MTYFTGKVFSARPAVDGDEQHVGRRLKAARKLAGLTQMELADRLGMQQSAIARIESQADIRVSILRQVIESLGGTLRIDARFKTTSRIARLDEWDFAFQSVDDDQLTFPIVGEDYFPPQRDVVFSIKPQYSGKIEAGEKTIELRRRFPVDVPEGTVALIYSTSPMRALTGIAEIEKVIVDTPRTIWSTFSDKACIEKPDYDAYFSGVDRACAIKLRSARPLRRPLGLNELRERFSFEPPQSFLYAKPGLREALTYECAEIPDRH